ncbi:conserved hypothetical protein [Actinacidiphila cocklensis]|uniref:HTH iclR-type domain-containing protein n=1 Tax=Actinacidiphila cocklensis TaxID=887465 RepID=A0A9W4DVA7_9ACTN|nr:conserved hypothetical protein [Actinacidiphila cocklensis]
MSEQETLLQKGLDTLRGLLGPEWEVRVQPELADQGDTGADAIVQLQATGDSAFAQLLVDTKTSLSPLAVREQLAPKAALMRRLQHYTQPLVITVALTEKTKQELRQHGIGYIDLLGNVWLRISRPAVVIMADSSQRAPRATSTAPPARPKLAGPRAGRLVRLLADVAPPYRASQLAALTQMSPGYVSKLLDTMEDLLLIRRDGRQVVTVDWAGLLRARAEQLNLLRHNPFVGMIAPNGPGPLLDAVRTLQKHEEKIVLTGSYAARQVAPLAVGGQVMLYVEATPNGPYELGEQLGLLPAEQGADVLLLRAHDKVVFDGATDYDGLRRVALSQLVLDCLSGPGRMPAEGEAVITYMADNEHEWRISGISALTGSPRP